MSENVFDVRRNWLLIAVKCAIVVLFLTGVYSTMSFLESTDNAMSSSFPADAEQNLYSITDTFLDDGAFERVRADPEEMAKVADFYNTLNTSEELTLISAFAQPIVVADFRGGDEFDAWLGAETLAPGEYVDEVSRKTVRDVRAVQMNKHAFEFAGLDVEQGTVPNWEAIDYDSGVIPVLLGAGYAGVYEVGDVLDAQFYSRDFTFQVSGLLPAGSSMYYKGDINTFLDDTMLVPYPPEMDSQDRDSPFFDGVLAFAMLNSDVAAPKTDSPDQVLNTIDRAARDTGFTDYAMIDVPQYLTQFSMTRELLQRNAGLMGMLQVLVGIVATVLVFAISAFALRRRLVALRLRWTLGQSRGTLQLSLASMVLVEWACIAVSLHLLYNALPTYDSVASSSIPWILAALAAIDLGCTTALGTSRFTQVGASA
ncbi:hypothetical protein C5B85_18305 [Pseudoclavibacter sp. AY1F1]|nr:hypothetical protein C5B85_18305 [Pseudoclavibacter sp. AY1F1]